MAICNRLRDRLVHVQRIFCENAADLFPEKIARLQVTMINSKAPSQDDPETQASDCPYCRAGGQRHSAPYISSEFQRFARDVWTLIYCFRQFPGFTSRSSRGSLHQSLGVELIVGGIYCIFIANFESWTFLAMGRVVRRS